MGEQQTAQLTLAPEEAEVACRVQSRLQDYKREHAADGRAARECQVHRPQATLRLGTSRVLWNRSSTTRPRIKGRQRNAFQPPFLHWTNARLLLSCVGCSQPMAQWQIMAPVAALALDSTSLPLLRQTQMLLLMFGIRARSTRIAASPGRQSPCCPTARAVPRNTPSNKSIVCISRELSRSLRADHRLLAR